MSYLKSSDKSYIEELHDDYVLAMLGFDGVVTTSQLRGLGIKSPTQVISRLKKDGYMIKKLFIPTKSKYREAIYVLTCGCENARVSLDRN